LKKSYFGLILLFLLPAPVLALTEKTVELSYVIKSLEAPFKVDTVRKEGGQSVIVDFQADFFQESLIASLDRVQRGKGSVSVKFDRAKTKRASQTMFRWEYQEPNHQEIVSDGKTMWVYLPENSQVIISDIDFSSPSSPSDPMTFLTGLGKLSRDFLITWASPDRDAGGNYVLELQPRRPSPMIQRMLVVVNRDAVLQTGAVSPPVFPMLSTTVVDPNGNSTAIEFRDVRVNRGLADSFFRFSPPEGVEVLRPTDGGTGF
jgi:outer membrane lipoprotein carrier protein